MPSVDNRVVRMEFDNAEFERRLQTTLGSLKNLNTALQMEGAKKGLSDISTVAGKAGYGISQGLSGAQKSITDLNSAAGKFSVDGISRGIEGVSKGFVAMSAVAITALANITTAAIHAGTGIVKSLALDNVIAGFQEYETNMNSIQTILANTKSQGSTLKDVNAALDTLNTYSDKTIYNFSQMAKNIGTFTAAGVDLKTSTSAIKGIANLAAVSGSNADQASTAMYQLSQALAAGSVKLMDWNSVVNAGMGGEVFKKNLFETGKALGTLKNVPMNQTFKQWEASGHKFRETLKDGWLTSEVLTTTLNGLAGEMTKGQLIAKGFSEEGAAGLVEMGKTGLDAAQDVKTFTQLMSTTKEAIGSGWGVSFRLIIGNFEQAKAMFTGFNKVISGMVGRMADARNKVLSDWQKLGGRDQLISGIYLAFTNLFKILKPIKDAFRDIFPAITGKRLAAITMGFYKFAKAMEPSKETVKNLRRIFTGLFSIFSIGFNVIKGLAGVFINLGKAIGGGLNVLGFLANIGDMFYALQQGLVNGKGIEKFFGSLTNLIKGIVPYISQARQFITDFFVSLGGGAAKTASTAAEVGLGRVNDRLSSLKDAFDKLKPVLDGFKTVFQAIGSALSAFGKKLADTFSSGNFNNILDLVNTGLFAGLLLLVRKFIKQGLKIDFSGGLFSKIGKTFETLTNTLKTMQLKIKADALFRIAEALGLLTLSLIALSLIDSGALTKALTATAVGLGQLVTVLATLDKLHIGPRTAATFAILALGMIALSAGMILMAFAAKKFGTMDFGQLAQGLAGITVLLGVVTGAVKLMSKSGADFIKAGVGLIAIGIALFFLGKAVQAFANLNLADMAKGFIGVSVGLTALAGALRLMPDEKKLPGTKLITTAIGLRILADTIKIFASMSWAELSRGFAALGAGLAALTVALRSMPTNMKEIGTGLLITSGALYIIAKVMQKFGGMSWADIAKGLVAIGLALGVIAIATSAMQASLAGAAAILVVSAALVILVSVIGLLSALNWETVLTSMLKLAAALVILGVAALALEPAIPALIGLSVALGLIGAAFALFGLGAMGVAKAFEILNRAGAKGAEGFINALKAILKVLPMVAVAFANFALDFLAGFLSGLPMLIGAFGAVLSKLLDLVITLIPKFQQVLGALIVAGLATIRLFAGEYIKTGLFILTTLLQGISDNIGEITNSVINIILAFIAAITERLPDIIAAGLSLLLAFLSGIADNVSKMVSTVATIIIKFTTEIANNLQKIIDAGVSVLVGFLKGITDNLVKITNAVGTVITRFIGALSENTNRIVTAGADLIISFLDGIRSKAPRVIKAFADTGVAVIEAFLNAIVSSVVALAKDVTTAFTNFFNGMAQVIRENSRALGDSMANFAEALVQGFGNAFFGAMKKILKDMVHAPFGLGGLINTAIDEMFSALGISSPSKVTYYMGEMLVRGLQKGIDDNVKNPPASIDNMSSLMSDALTRVSDTLSNTEEFNPTITPVLDLTRVAADASLINGYIPSLAGVGGFSTAQARAISASELARQNALANGEISPGGTSPVKFEQNIYAPDQLSMADIYKQTRNQIIMAKEELKIP